MVQSISMRARLSAACAGLFLLAGCATMPSSGPTGAEVRRSARSADNTIGFAIVDVTAPVLADVNARAAVADGAVATLASLNTAGRNDALGPGDILSIGIYEVGVSLFGGARDTQSGYDSSAKGENFPAIVIDRTGSITLPYVGRLLVAGHTPDEVQDMIVHALRGKSQSPQAVVTVRSNVSNTVFVAGDVHRPGRFDLTLQRERLLDAIALGGGTDGTAEDTIVRFNRGSRTIEERLGRIQPGAIDDLVLIPGDRIELIRRPRSFLVLGATSKISQVPFETGDLSLAEAVARAGGPSDAQADPKEIFLFRYDPAVRASDEKPVIYRLNMMQPANYFLAQRFAIRDKDVVYVANAAANRPAKLIAIINQLFGPLVTARALTQ